MTEEEMNRKWDARFMALAAHIAQWSKDPSTKVGCVIVDPMRRILGTGYNGFPMRVQDTETRYNDRPTKYKMVVHSEANAILTAPHDLAGATLYCTMFPCSECTKMIVQKQISDVVAPMLPNDSTWLEDAKFSLVMLREAGVNIWEP